MTNLKEGTEELTLGDAFLFLILLDCKCIKNYEGYCTAYG